jgi:hypothetical protein
MPEGTPFGPGIASMTAYLRGCQMIALKRLIEVCQGLFGLTISQGDIANVLARVGEAIAAPAERIAVEVRVPWAFSRFFEISAAVFENLVRRPEAFSRRYGTVGWTS